MVDPPWPTVCVCVYQAFRWSIMLVDTFNVRMAFTDGHVRHSALNALRSMVNGVGAMFRLENGDHAQWTAI